MARKAFITHLNEEHEIKAEYAITDGEITDFCVRLEFKGQCIRRYDTAHNHAHQDVLRKRHSWAEKVRRKECLLDKVDCTNIGTYQEVFEHALRDYKENYAQYSQGFERS